MIEWARTKVADHCELDQTRSSAGSNPCAHEVYDRESVAGLSDWAIEAMSDADLARVIRGCRFRELRPEVKCQLDLLGRRWLKSLLYILRRNFREQLVWAK